MTEGQIEERLRGLLREVKGGSGELKRDFRKLVARYECTAGENLEICSRYRSGVRGGCSFQEVVGSTVSCGMMGAA